MGRVRFRARVKVRVKMSCKNIVPGSTKFVDPGMCPTQKNQDSDQRVKERKKNIHLQHKTQMLDIHISHILSDVRQMNKSATELEQKRVSLPVKTVQTLLADDF